MCASGGIRLKAVLQACAQHLPVGTMFTKPEGGMNLWVTLPAGLDSTVLARHAERIGVSYLPGHAFEVNADHSRSFRLSFAGLTPEQITSGLTRLGKLFASAIAGVLPRERVPEALV